MAKHLKRRRLLSAVPAIGFGATALHATIPHSHGSAAAATDHAGANGGHGTATGHAAFRGGEVDHRANGFDPHQILRDFDGGETSRMADGRTLREGTLVASEHEIEIAPGRAVHRVVLQRAHPRADAARHGGRPPADQPIARTSRATTGPARATARPATT